VGDRAVTVIPVDGYEMESESSVGNSVGRMSSVP
jgi:hypothetical protein